MHRSSKEHHCTAFVLQDKGLWLFLDASEAFDRVGMTLFSILEKGGLPPPLFYRDFFGPGIKINLVLLNGTHVKLTHLG